MHTYILLRLTKNSNLASDLDPERTNKFRLKSRSTVRLNRRFLHRRPSNRIYDGSIGAKRGATIEVKWTPKFIRRHYAGFAYNSKSSHISMCTGGNPGRSWNTHAVQGDGIRRMNGEEVGIKRREANQNWNARRKGRKNYRL